MAWVESTFRGVAMGLAHAQDTSNDFDNIIDLVNRARIIDFAGVASQLPRLCVCTFVFLLRVPPEGLCMKRARIDDLVTRRPINSQSILGIVGEGGSPKLLP